MSEWWRYRLSDFLMYSARTWYRLVEQYNDALWPAHLVAILLGLVVSWLALRPRPERGRAIAAITALLWSWVAIVWHLQYFLTINWAARWFAAGFGLQALLLLWFGVVRRDLTFDAGVRRMSRVGLGILIFAVWGYPLIAIGSHRGAVRSEVFGMMPDPTALGTIGLLLMTERRRWLIVIPILWCLIGWGMLWYLE